MTYAQALMIVRNAASGYTQAEIRKAAVFVLGSLGANEEDCLDAGNALGYVDSMHAKATLAPGARCDDLDDHDNGKCVKEVDVELQIENVVGGLRNYGYLVTSKPIPGNESEYYQDLRKGLNNIEATIEGYRKHFRVRGSNTKRIREMLWRDLPEPCWGAHAPVKA